MASPIRAEATEPKLPRKASRQIYVTVPQTDTGRWVENTKGIGRTFVKELGKLDPQLREKDRLCRMNVASPRESEEAAEKWLYRLFTKNTGLCEVVRRSIQADACPVPEGQGEG
eukprot:TRINITY_DN161_c0_g1_i3.p3 TRINITY_DN161_c0_g1~~TRINITY_DN161_c0_g1_i3.p3  ORF type:complete len:114 (-),score=8.14 TRINITY_DN161_c0_g1_i3:138-479(-)